MSLEKSLLENLEKSVSSNERSSFFINRDIAERVCEVTPASSPLRDTLDPLRKYLILLEY